ncbi:hypothetical protein Tco_0162415 [Tanacetum coccineum]
MNHASTMANPGPVECDEEIEADDGLTHPHRFKKRTPALRIESPMHEGPEEGWLGLKVFGIGVRVGLNGDQTKGDNENKIEGHELRRIKGYTFFLCSLPTSVRMELGNLHTNLSPLVSKDCPLPDGLKMPNHIGTYDEKRDPDNYLHTFVGTIWMQKWLMPVACHMFTYILRDSA